MAGIDNAGIVIAVAIVAIALGAAASLGASQDAGPSIPIPKPTVQEKEVEETPKSEKVVEKPVEETVEVEEEPMMEEETVGPQTHSVEIPVGTSVPGCENTDSCYLPANITINAGDTVEWPNIDTAAHTVTSGSPAEGPSGVFDSSLLMASATFAFTFEDAGEYDYFCMVHPWMIGSVSVTEGSMMEETVEEEPMMEEETVEEEPMMEEETVEVEEEPMMEEETVGPQTHSVEIPVGTSVPGCENTDSCYLPANITINAGDTVEWPNIDTAAHTVTSGSPAEGPSGVFDSSLLMASATFAFTFEDAGEYDYFCMVHPWMIGSVSVN